MRRVTLKRVLMATVVLVAAAAAVWAAAPNEEIASPLIDGKTADWEGVPTVTSETEPKLTALTQDDRFLYAYFQSGDLDLARRALRSGVILWVNTGGAHAEGYGLRFRGTEAVQKAVDAAVAERRAAESSAAAKAGAAPADQPAATPVAQAPATGQQASNRRRNWQGAAPRAPLGTLEVIKDGTVNELINTGARDDGPAAACSFVAGTLVYEFRVPFAELGLPKALTQAGGERGVAVGFQMSGRTQAERQAAATRQGGRRQRNLPASPWSQAQQRGGGEPQGDDAGAADGARGADGAADGAAGATGATEGRRRNYPTQWQDVSITLPAPPAAR